MDMNYYLNNHMKQIKKTMHYTCRAFYICYFNFMLITDKMFNQLEFPTDLSITIDVGFGVDAPVIGKHFPYILNLNDGYIRNN